MSATYSCAGTKSVAIDGGEDGLVTVFHYVEEKSRRSRSTATTAGGRKSSVSSETDVLHILVTDGLHTFYERWVGLDIHVDYFKKSTSKKCVCVSLSTTDSRFTPCTTINDDTSGPNSIDTSSCRVKLEDIKHMDREEDPLSKVESILLKPEEAFKVSYKQKEVSLVGGSQDQTDATSVQVSIRKIFQNSVVRPVWEGYLKNVCHHSYDDLPLFVRTALPGPESQTAKSSGLLFAQLLSSTVTKLHREHHIIVQESKGLEAKALRWKSTSEKLSGVWEREKSELTDRFLTLFNDHKRRHIETKEELDELKRKHGMDKVGPTLNGSEEKPAATEDTSKGNENDKPARKSGRFDPDDEDVHDMPEYNAEMVRRYASGIPAENTLKRRADALNRQAARRAEEGEELKRPNLGRSHTTATTSATAYDSDADMDARADKMSYKMTKANMKANNDSDSDVEMDGAASKPAETSKSRPRYKFTRDSSSESDTDMPTKPPPAGRKMASVHPSNPSNETGKSRYKYNASDSD